MLVDMVLTCLEQLLWMPTFIPLIILWSQIYKTQIKEVKKSMNKREQWGSELVLYWQSGSAVGLGNIWKYPHMAGENGGAAFTVIYLICILIVGLPIVIAEFVIGRKTQLSPVGAFKVLAPNTNWKFVGVLGVCAAFVILSFYGVVGGWTLRYTMLSLLVVF